MSSPLGNPDLTGSQGLRLPEDRKSEQFAQIREEAVTIVHALECTIGCGEAACKSARVLLSHLVSCQKETDCSEECQRMRTMVYHLKNCGDRKCLLCRKLVDKKVAALLPDIACNVEQSDPSNLGELLQIMAMGDDSCEGEKDSNTSSTNLEDAPKKEKSFKSKLARLVRKKSDC